VSRAGASAKDWNPSGFFLPASFFGSILNTSSCSLPTFPCATEIFTSALVPSGLPSSFISCVSVAMSTSGKDPAVHFTIRGSQAHGIKSFSRLHS